MAYSQTTSLTKEQLNQVISTSQAFCRGARLAARGGTRRASSGTQPLTLLNWFPATPILAVSNIKTCAPTSSDPSSLHAPLETAHRNLFRTVVLRPHIKSSAKSSMQRKAPMRGCHVSETYCLPPLKEVHVATSPTNRFPKRQTARQSRGSGKIAQVGVCP